MPTPLSKSSAALWSTIGQGVSEFEKALAKGGQGIGLFGLGLSLIVGTLISTNIAVGTLVISVACVLWFSLIHEMLLLEKYQRVIVLASPVFEITLPSLYLIALTLRQGPEYSLASWVPPELYSVVILVSIVRLKPWLPVLSGAIAATHYGLIYFFLILPRLGADPNLLFQPKMQCVRIATLFFTGILGRIAVIRLRRAIEEANSMLRSKHLFGKYRLGEVIGSGGMGQVFRAVYCPEGGFEREVAVKLIHTHLATNPLFVQNFRQEARLTARLSHPNIVQALDFGKVDQTYFLSMEYIEGTTLQDMMTFHREVNRPIPINLVVYIGQQVANALQYAHFGVRTRRGEPLHIIHRDLSPANILLSKNGTVKLTDFGVARAMGQAPQLGSVVGKPSYLAPEQIQDDLITPRIDLFSLGVILWELLANQRLFLCETAEASMNAVVSGSIPPIHELRPSLQADWSLFFFQALAQNPEERFQSAELLCAALLRLNIKQLHLAPEGLSRLIDELQTIDEIELD